MSDMTVFLTPNESHRLALWLRHYLSVPGISHQRLQAMKREETRAVTRRELAALTNLLGVGLEVALQDYR